MEYRPLVNLSIVGQEPFEEKKCTVISLAAHFYLF